MAQPRRRSLLAPLVLTLCIILFICTGLTLIPQLGIQTDEAIFTGVMFPEAYPWFAISIFKNMTPLMVMSYMGAAKAALYVPIFAMWDPSAYTLRIPALLLGAISLVLFYLFLKRTAGPRAALFGTTLLSFDTCYLLTSVFDWGPVAIQHVCLLGALALLLKYGQQGCERALAGGFFLLGFGMWDKAIFAWMLSGIAIAALVVFPLYLLRNLKPKPIILATVFFCLGSLPLLIYNVRKPLETFRGNTTLTGENALGKLRVLEATARGNGLEGFFGPSNGDSPRTPLRAVDQVFAAVSDLAGGPRQHWIWQAWCASILLTPVLFFTRWRKPMAFAIVTMLVAGAQMFLTKDAGGSVHHVILMWPLPIFMIAIAMEWAAERAGRYGNALTAGIGVFLCGSCFLVNSTYAAHFARYGSGGAWTDAIYPLTDFLEGRKAQAVQLADWGMLDNVRMLSRGRIRVRIATEPLTAAEVTPAMKSYLAQSMEAPNTVFVSNTDDRQIFPNVNSKLAQLAEELGFERHPVTTIADRMGRPSFEVFEFRKRPAPASVDVTEGERRGRVPAVGRVGRVLDKQPAVK